MSAAHPTVALLAPVPLEHLESALAVCEVEGKVAFGSRAWQVFRQLGQHRKRLPVDVYLYASHAGPQDVRAATWRAVYIGQVASDSGAHPEGMRYRPPTTTQSETDSAGHWVLFWEVRDLRQVPGPERIKTGQFKGLGEGRAYRDNIAPEGPLLVEHP